MALCILLTYFRVEYEKRVRREAAKYSYEVVQKQMLG